MCVYGGGVVPKGGVGDRHLVTVPQGVVGDHLPWGGERQWGGGGGYMKAYHLLLFHDYAAANGLSMELVSWVWIGTGPLLSPEMVRYMLAAHPVSSIVTIMGGRK